MACENSLIGWTKKPKLSILPKCFWRLGRLASQSSLELRGWWRIACNIPKVNNGCDPERGGQRSPAMRAHQLWVCLEEKMEQKHQLKSFFGLQTSPPAIMKPQQASKALTWQALSRKVPWVLPYRAGQRRLPSLTAIPSQKLLILSNLGN